jgi:AdoMet-dependent heme synthase
MEGIRLLEEIRSLGNPLMVLTGGDPLKRPDLFQLIKKSVSLGLRTHLSPSATPLLTREVVREFKKAGVSRMDLSLNGWDAATHDGFHGAYERFDTAMEALEEARDIGLETQVLTTVTEHNLWDLNSIAELVERVKARLWSLFFLSVTPRVQEGDDLTSEEYETVLEELHYISRRASFDIHTTEGIDYQRQTGGKRIARSGTAKGFVFISHTGEIHPSAFLPVSAGNVRFDPLGDVIRNSSLFRILHEAGGHHGTCGRCRFRKVCGGARAWAYALTSDDLVQEARPVHEAAVSGQQMTK